MNMTDHWDKPWERLSLGMMKKTGLIAAFLPKVPLRMFDEPFAGGIDPMAMEQLYTWMAEAKAHGETILFSTQVLEQAENAADRLLLLEDGAIRALATPAALIVQAGIDPNEPRALYKAFLAMARHVPV